MSSSRITESAVEEVALSWFEGLGYTVLHGPAIAPGEPAAERRDEIESERANGRHPD